MKTSIAFMMGIAFLCAAVGVGDEAPLAWPQFRGPGGSGVADDQRPPVEFGPEKNVKWKVTVPSGLSSPIVVGDKLVITAYDSGKLYTIAYGRGDGGEAWRAEAPAREIEPFLQAEGSPAASTSVTDGTRIISYFGSCGLICYDTSGKELWRYEMPLAATMADFGSGVSPILSDSTVVLLRDETKDPKIIALDASTGQVKWEKKRQSRGGFCTPVVWDTPAGKQVAAPGSGQMTGYDLRTGEEKWHVVGMPSASCASPVTANGDLFFAAWSPGDPSDDAAVNLPTFDGLLKMPAGGDANGDGAISKEEAQAGPMKDFLSSMDTNKDGKLTRAEYDATIQFMASSQNSAFALKAGGSGDVTTTHVRWKKTKGLPYVPSAIVYRDQHVMVKDGGIVTAYDVKSGDEIYQKRAGAPGSYYSSPVAANGNIYIASLTDGSFSVLRAGTATLELVSQNPPLGERLAATPAIADHTLYVRTAWHLYAFAQED